MSEIMDDFDAGYKKGLLDGYTKSIVLIRHLQRAYNNMDCEQEILEEAMELIAEKIEPKKKNLDII